MWTKSFILCLNEIQCFLELTFFLGGGAGSSVHEIFQARVLECVAIFVFLGIFLTQGSNLHPLRLLHWQEGSLPLSH